MPLEPTPAQLEQLASLAADQPVVMLNLLRFKERADGIDAADGITGAEAYGRYSTGVIAHLERVGGRVLFAGSALASIIGPEAAEWDLALAVEYPSPQAFLAMVSDPDYQSLHEHRAAALADTRLIACAGLPTQPL
jgi:uncharacterized protein (DUF1330 family)